ncbi:hypothetical protein [Leptospira noguchii]|uniref:hypothetical protein n=1 Tax=Leptospira noguchii TaxID=28182 RepID=UPI0003142F77|nr:hypothetical protein [Leptospira noguchii]UOG48422.1 hypothetical protein MAL00_15765 [Leptospira noguchii]
MIRLIFAGWKDNHTSGAVLSLQNNSAKRFPELNASLPKGCVNSAKRFPTGRVNSAKRFPTGRVLRSNLQSRVLQQGTNKYFSFIVHLL